MFSGTSKPTEQISNVHFNWLTSLSYDPVTNSLYFSDHLARASDDEKNGVIGLIHLETLTNHNIYIFNNLENISSISVDYINRNIYWIENEDSIWIGNLNNGKKIKLISLNNSKSAIKMKKYKMALTSLVVDPVKRRMFYSQCNMDPFSPSQNGLISCDLSGMNCLNSLESFQVYLNKRYCISRIAINTNNEKMSFIEDVSGKIFSGKIESSTYENNKYSNDDNDDKMMPAGGDVNKIWTGIIRHVRGYKEDLRAHAISYMRNQLTWINEDHKLYYMPDDFSVKNISLENGTKYFTMVTADGLNKDNIKSICTSTKPLCSDICVINLMGRRSCLCPQGFLLRYDYLCIKDDSPCFYRHNGQLTPVCSDICKISNENHFECTCRSGRKLLEDKRSCTADVHAPIVYLGSKKTLTRLMDNRAEICEELEFNWLTSLSFDPITFSVFFSDRLENDNSNKNKLIHYEINDYNINNDNNGNELSYADEHGNDVIGLIHMETLTK
ncbi:hypothetical protein HELRODRAFT_165064 [Helobdella robusta]|uniref:EGF-like domain-containing protein n=1 Tax=Helobdella robusta TaxID=6412 RepID=T1EW86_HELRO|nr:hypothetical protein HELRODRAFT_165064 [Helobdella robusta]ESN92928.1 hypothetical protein HELRODRAFT_165064 [Helobdella robusta]